MWYLIQRILIKLYIDICYWHPIWTECTGTHFTYTWVKVQNSQNPELIWSGSAFLLRPFCPYWVFKTLKLLPHFQVPPFNIRSLLLHSDAFVVFYCQNFNDYMGESSKFPKSWTFETPILKLAVCPLNIHNFNFNGQLSLPRLYINPGKPIIISLIQHFEANFLWKIGLKILNSGIILKTFTHATIC